MRRGAWMAVTLAIACGGGSATAAATLDGAKSMVERTYRAYCSRCEVDFDRQSRRLFSARLLALVARDRRLTPAGDVGALDGDPICDCQDFAITDVRVAVQGAGPGRAVATARFRNFADRQTVRLDLVVERGAWRIDDIHSASTPDLADYLEKHAGGR